MSSTTPTRSPLLVVLLATFAMLLPAPAVLAAPVEEDRAVVGAWYEDFLGRSAADDPGSQYWVDRLGVQAPADVLWSLTHTREHTVRQVQDYYLYLLGRGLDPGAGYWVDGATAQRFPLEWVLQNVAASPEYVAGRPAAQVVRNWYAVVFTRDLSTFGEDTERTPGDGEIAYWSGRIVAVGHLAAFRELYYAPEVVAARVGSTYADLLGRSPSAGEVAYWSPKEVESDVNVTVLVGATPEYRQQVLGV